MRSGVRHIVIVGLMGAGKSTVGERLASRLAWVWRDSDRDIEEATGRTVRELRDDEGVDRMHDRESDQLLVALADRTPSVVSAAASVIDVPACRAALADPGVAVVWLRASPAVLARRFGSAAHRPAYGVSPEAFLADQAARRDPWFTAAADVVVDIDDLSEDEVVARAIEGLG